MTGKRRVWWCTAFVALVFAGVGANPMKAEAVKTEAAVQEKGTGDFTVSGGIYGTDYSFTGHTLTVLTEKPLTVTGTTNEDRILIRNGVNADLTLKNISIRTNDCALDIEGSEVLLKLAGSSTLKSGYGNPGIRVPKNAALTIADAKEGSLTVSGGESAAGIGTTSGNSFGNIVIESGQVEAKGGKNGAGIGSGLKGADGSVRIEGGSVTAKGGTDAADLGNGKSPKAACAVILDGNAVLTVDSFPENGEREKGLLLEEKNGMVYGSISIAKDFTIPAGMTLTIPADAMLRIGEDCKVTNRGTICLYGTVNISGSLQNSGKIISYQEGIILQEENMTGDAADDGEEGEIRLESGDITFTRTGYEQNGAEYQMPETGDGCTIIGDGRTTAHSVTVENGVKLNLVLDQVQWKQAAGSRVPVLKVGEGAQVSLYLRGSSKITSDGSGTAAPIQVADSASVQLYGSGTLTLEGVFGAGKLVLDGLGDSAGTKSKKTGESASENDEEDGVSEEALEAEEEKEGTESPEKLYDLVVYSGARLEDTVLDESKEQDGEDEELSVYVRSSGSRYSLIFDRAALDAIIDSGQELIVKSSFLTIEMDKRALRDLKKAVPNGAVTLSVQPFELSGDSFSVAQKAIGNRPVYDIQVSGNGGVVHAPFDTGRVWLIIPYELDRNERGEDLCVAYVGGDNRLYPQEYCEYDEEEETFVAKVEHFSVYGIMDRKSPVQAEQNKK